MNEFEVVLVAEAQSDLRRLPPTVRGRLPDKLQWIGDNVQLIIHQPLKGEEWDNAFKYRVGDYRIIYRVAIDQRRIVVLRIGHRREVYKR